MLLFVQLQHAFNFQGHTLVLPTLHLNLTGRIFRSVPPVISMVLSLNFFNVELILMQSNNKQSVLFWTFNLNRIFGICVSLENIQYSSSKSA